MSSAVTGSADGPEPPLVLAAKLAAAATIMGDVASDPTTAPKRRRARSDAGKRADRSREKILAVASKMIARQGIAGLRVETVAELADVSTSLLYYHFGSRSGLVNAAFEFASEQAPSTALRVLSDQRSGYEALEDALLAELDDSPSVRDYAIVWGEVGAAAVFDSKLRPAIRRITLNWAAIVAGAIERGIADGSIRKEVDPESTAELLIVLVDGFCLRWLAGSLELERARTLMSEALGQLKAAS